MARRRTRRRKRSYVPSDPPPADGSPLLPMMEDLSPRARRLVEAGVIDLEVIAGSGPGGKITSGDILHAARVMEVQQSVARIETVQGIPAAESPPQIDLSPAGESPGTDYANDEVDGTEPALGREEPVEDSEVREATVPAPADASDGVDEPEVQAQAPSAIETEAPESATSSAGHVGGEPIATQSSPWDHYNGASEGFSDRARFGAEQSWGEAEAHLAAMAAEAEANDVDQSAPDPVETLPADEAAQIPTEETAAPDLAESTYQESIEDEQDAGTPTAEMPVPAIEPEPAREVMMDFGTLELVDPESVWAEGAEDFAPWFLAHSRQLGDVLGLDSGLSNARQFTTKSATGVLGTDDNGEDVVVVSSQNAIADDSDLGRALGMAASSGAASVALVSATLHEDQLKALAWLNNQTKSGVKWYGIEMRVVRIADSPAAMLFDLVASPPAP